MAYDSTKDVEARSATRRAGNTAAASVVVVAMIVAALSLWTVIPLTWVWIGSMLSEGQAPSVGPYMATFAGIVVSILIVSWLLGRLNRLYMRITGSRNVAPIRPTWLKSLRDSEEKMNPTVLETVIVTSVILAAVSMGIWFMVAAGSPLPSQ